MSTTSEQFGRYELRGELGRGGFATVYRAWDPSLGREVALKALQPHLASEPNVRQRFLVEARTIARLHHPNIVTVYEVDTLNDRPFFTMELIEGPTLRTLTAAGEGLPLPLVAYIIQDLASAVDYLRTHRLVHRDIKASNVMLDTRDRIVLMDFGVARVIDETQLTNSGVSIGTPEAMSPEQVHGQPAGPAADIYALGVLVYRLLAGRPPFIGDSIHVVHAHAYEPPPPLAEFRPGLPRRVYAAIDAALEKSPEDRPSEARILAAAFMPLQVTEEPEPTRLTFHAPPQRVVQAETGPREATPPSSAPAPSVDKSALPAVPGTADVQAPAGEPHPSREQGHSNAERKELPTQSEPVRPPKRVQRDPALRPVPAATATSSRGETTGTSERSPHRRGLWFGGAAVVVILLAGASIAVVAERSGGHGTPSPAATAVVAANPAAAGATSPTASLTATAPASVARATTAATTATAVVALPIGTPAPGATQALTATASAAASPPVTPQPALVAASVTVVGGSGTAGYRDGAAAQAEFSGPTGVAVDANGVVYVADTDNSRIRRISSDGQISTYAGPGPTVNNPAGYADQPGGAARFSKPRGIVVDKDGVLYVADTGNNRIRRIDPAGAVATLAGSGGTDVGSGGFADGPGGQARFNLPTGLALAPDGSLYIADQRNNRIRKIDRNGVVSSVAGSSERGRADGKGAAARFDSPSSVATDRQGNVYVADTFNGLVRKITPDGDVSTYAGGGNPGTLEGPALNVGFTFPNGIAVDSAGNVYVADQTHSIRRIAPDGTVVIVAGGSEGFANGSGREARFEFPSGLALRGDDGLYVADTSNNRVRLIGLR